MSVVAQESNILPKPAVPFLGYVILFGLGGPGRGDEGVAGMLSTTVQKTFPKGLPKGLPKGFPKRAPKGFPKGVPKGFPKGFPKGLPKGVPALPGKTAEKTAENLPKKRNARSGNSGNGTKPSILNPKLIFQQFFWAVFQGVIPEPRRRAEKNPKAPIFQRFF